MPAKRRTKAGTGLVCPIGTCPLTEQQRLADKEALIVGELAWSPPLRSHRGKTAEALQAVPRRASPQEGGGSSELPRASVLDVRAVGPLRRAVARSSTTGWGLGGGKIGHPQPASAKRTCCWTTTRRMAIPCFSRSSEMRNSAVSPPRRLTIRRPGDRRGVVVAAGMPLPFGCLVARRCLGACGRACARRSTRRQRQLHRGAAAMGARATRP